MKQGSSPLSRSGCISSIVSKLTGNWDRVLTPFVGWAPGMTAEAPDVPFVQGNFLNVLCLHRDRAGDHPGVPAVGLGAEPGNGPVSSSPSPVTACHLLDQAPDRHRLAAVVHACCRSWRMPYGPRMPGTHAGPFEWSMTGPAFQLLAALAAGVPWGVCQWHPAGALVRVAALAPGIGGRSCPVLFAAAALVAARFPDALARGRLCSSATFSSKRKHAISECAAASEGYSRAFGTLQESRLQS